MTAIALMDLDLNVELDRNALAAVAGGSNYSFYTYSSWQRLYKTTTFLSNVYVSGQGWKKRYQIAEKWHRNQYYYRGYELVA